MLDSLVIHLPIKEEFVKQTGNLYSIIGDVADYQIKAVPSYLKRDLITAKVTYGELKHPYEALPTSFSSMAIKFNSTNVANTYPYISMSASPKILQGHNVYGGESVKNLASEMLFLLNDYYPEFFACLDVSNASISRIDSTYSVRLENEHLVKPLLRYLSNVSNGQRKNDTDRRDFYNTVYFGGRTSRHGNAVIYGKYDDVMREYNELKKAEKRGSCQAVEKLKVFTPDLIEYSKSLLRFESRTKKRKLEQIGLPTNLWLFIKHQQKNRDVLSMLWKLWFMPIIEALEGTIMQDYDDSDILKLCREKLVTTTPKGKPSYTKANNAFNFYQLLKIDGYKSVKERYSNNAFHTAVRSLVSLGIPRSLLQNLSQQQNTTIPVVQLLNIDFAKQYPDNYKPPVSKHINFYDVYLRADINLVA